MIQVGRKGKHYREKKTVAIDMAPLIDMVFILLIFFIVTSTFAPETSVEITRPEMSQVSVVPSKSLTIEIDESENIIIAGNKVSLAHVETYVRAQVRSKAEVSVLVLSDKKVSVDVVLKVLDACRNAGVEASIAAKEAP